MTTQLYRFITRVAATFALLCSFVTSLWAQQLVIYASIGSAPSIATTNEQVLTVNPGQSINLSITSGGQWFKNDAGMPFTSATYTPVTTGFYRAKANGSYSNYVYVDFLSATADKNYTKVDQIRTSNIKNEEGINALGSSKLNQRVTYQDGLGRPVQQLDVAATAQTGKDFVQTFVYDAQGEQPKAYLPFALGSNGQYKADWQNAQGEFYGWSSPKVGRSGNGPAYAQTVTDADPISRVKEQAAPGESWKLDGGHTRKQTQRSNRSADAVWLWSYQPATALGSLGTLTKGSQAGANTLQVVEVLDEDAKLTVSYSNELGQTICTRVYLTGSPATNSSATYLETNYCHDLQGNSVVSISPKATKGLLDNTLSAADALDKLCFVTGYDNLNRVIAKKTPGVGWSYILYDRWNRVAATRDTRGVNQNTWNYTKFDALNRPIVTGRVYEYRSPSTLYGVLQNLTDDQRFEDRADTPTGYTLAKSYPFTAQEDFVSTTAYYDDYNYYPLQSPARTDLAYITELGNAAATTQTKGLRTGGRQRVLDYDDAVGWLTEVTYYDEFARPLQSFRDNHTQSSQGEPAVDRTTFHYEDGLQTQSLQTHVRYSDAGVKETHLVKLTNGYDAKGRVTSISESIDNSADVRLVAYEYNELGQVVDKKLGYNSSDNSYLQSLDYRYNIRGWLTNINNRNLQEGWLDGTDPNEDGDANADLFGLELKYATENPANYCYYNGNISAAVWNSHTPKGDMRRYLYSYDAANRLTGGSYGSLTYTNGNYAFDGEKTDPAGEGHYTLNGLDYDENGNIRALKRNGLVATPAGQAKQFGQLDDLQLAYDGNQLTTVVDNAQGGNPTAATNDFENNGVAGTDPYGYDEAGNMTYDPHKKATITYDYLNLPAEIDCGNDVNGYAQNLIYNSYSSTGAKLRSSYYTFQRKAYRLVKSVDYIGSFTYTSNAPTTLATPVGRAVVVTPATSSNPRTYWGLEYHLRDHQGSLRMVIRQDPQVAMFAGMEPSNSEREETDFDNVAKTRQLDPDHARTGNYAARLNAGQIDRATGPYTTFPVAKGDSVQIEVYGRYDGARKGHAFAALAAGSAVSVTPGSNQVSQTELPQLQQQKKTAVFIGVTAALGKLFGLFARREVELPRASLTYEFYDKDSLLVSSKTLYLDENGQQNWEQLSGGEVAEKAGYVKVFLVNSSGKDVWFDDLKIANRTTASIQENHYDPFGQNLPEIETISSFDSNLQFTNQEICKEFGLNTYDFKSRQYNFQLGRFQGVDIDAVSYPSQGSYNYVLNNPTAYVDPDGKNPVIILGAVIGLINGLQHGQSVNAHGWRLLEYGLEGAAIGAFSSGVGSAVSAGGGLLAGTKALAYSSLSSSALTRYATNGMTDITANLGLASYNFTNNELGYLGKRGNSGADNFGYILSASTVASDIGSSIVDSNASQILQTRNADDELINVKVSGWFKSKYIGPGPDIDPRKLAINNPPDSRILADSYAYNHDISYYDAGVGGKSGALFSKRVIGADAGLAAGAWYTLPKAVSILIKDPSVINFNSFAASTLIASSFTAITAFKIATSYSYLYPIVHP